jgi:hypothetical protein
MVWIRHVGVSKTDDYGIVRFAPFYIYLSRTSLGCGGLVYFREALTKDCKATSMTLHGCKDRHNGILYNRNGHQTSWHLTFNSITDSEQVNKKLYQE